MRATINGDVRYRFTGREYDSEFGLYNFRARLYDDELGIFYATDITGQNFSPFSYAGNNPIIYIDKNGKFFWIPLAILAAAGTYGAIKGAIEGGWQGAIYGFGSMTTVAGFAMASLAGSVLSGGSLGAALMFTSFQTMWAATQGENIGELITGAAASLTTSWLSSSGLAISDKLGGSLWAKLATQAGITTTNSIINNLANNREPLENLKVGVGPIVLNVNGSKPVDIFLSDNLFEAIGHTLGFANFFTGGDIDFSWENLSFRFSGGLYQEYILDADWPFRAGGNSVFGVAWTKSSTNNFSDLSTEEFRHVWQSRFFSGNQYFLTAWLGGVLREFILQDFTNIRDAYNRSFYELD